MGYIYPMFIEPTITWVPSGFSGYIWLDTKKKTKKTMLIFFFLVPCNHPHFYTLVTSGFRNIRAADQIIFLTIVKLTS